MRTRVILVAGLVAAGLVAAGLGVYVLVRPDVPAAAPPPITPSADSPSEVAIPRGMLTADAKSARPVADQGLRWERAEGRDLPTLISPCGEVLPSEADRVAGRQVVLVGTQLWKAERLVVYRDAAAARRALAERRDALDRCAHHPERDGVHTVWRWEPLRLGDEAMFVAGQRMRGDEGLPGHHRAVLARQGRALAMFVDFGQARAIADRSEVTSYERDAATVVARVRAAAWS
jgi:hypothetical protein